MTDADATAPKLKRIDQVLFDAVARDAQQRPRLRLNHNLHQSSDLVQRFLNVLHPGTYCPPAPARARRPGHGIRMLSRASGAIGLLLFNAEGELIQQERLEQRGPYAGLNWPKTSSTAWWPRPQHRDVRTQTGPHQPTADKDFLALYPAEGDPRPLFRSSSGGLCSTETRSATSPQRARTSSRKRCFSCINSASSCSIKRLTRAWNSGWQPRKPPLWRMGRCACAGRSASAAGNQSWRWCSRCSREPPERL